LEAEMKRYDSDPFELAQADVRQAALVAEPSDFSRADLVFYGVDHSGPSYEAWIFLNNPDATFDTPPDVELGYAGRLNVFGHGGCYGEAGHCEVRDRFSDEFDVRGEHPLTPFTIAVDVTEAVRRLGTSEITVTVIPRVASGKGPRTTDTLSFDHLRIVTYDHQ
jgi:hypothetical protein